MELPRELILESIEEPCICRFKEKTHAPDAPAHFYVAIPIHDNMDLVVCIITSRVRERLAYYGEHGVVLLVENTFSFLTKGSLVDCNQAMLVPKAELPQIIDEKEGFSIKTRDLADDFLKEILIAIEGSDVAKKDIKTAVKNSPMSSRLFPNTR